MHVCDHKTHNGHAESRKNNSIDTQKAISVDQTQKLLARAFTWKINLIHCSN